MDEISLLSSWEDEEEVDRVSEVEFESAKIEGKKRGSQHYEKKFAKKKRRHATHPTSRKRKVRFDDSITSSYFH